MVRGRKTMEKQPKNELRKIGEDKYELKTEFENMHRTDVFNTGFLRDAYKSGVEEYNRVLEQLKKINKQLKEKEYTKQEIAEIEEFVRLNNAAREYEDYKKAQNQRDNALDMVERLRQQKEDIERVMPEVKRMKK